MSENSHETKRFIALQVAWHFLGRPYIWGGDNPITGFDCSGFCIEVLRSVGVLPRKGDFSADGLWNLFSNICQVSGPGAGCLVFWNNSTGTKIIHVELALSEELAIGASGGGSTTRTMADAIQQDAFIKIRPIASRSNIKGYVDPFKVVA